VKLIFLSLLSADSAVERVRARMSQGGHSIAEHVIRRRFDAGLKNFENTYKTLVDSWILYDNSGDQARMIQQQDSP
jgi:predicted ABC-type ATPase